MRRAIIIIFSIAIGGFIGYIGVEAIQTFFDGVRLLPDGAEWTDVMRIEFLNYAWITLFGLMLVLVPLLFIGRKNKTGIAAALLTLHVFALGMQMQLLISATGVFAGMEVLYLGAFVVAMMPLCLFSIILLISHLLRSEEQVERQPKVKKEKPVKEKAVKQEPAPQVVIAEEPTPAPPAPPAQEIAPQPPQPQPQQPQMPAQPIPSEQKQVFTPPDPDPITPYTPSPPSQPM